MPVKGKHCWMSDLWIVTERVDGRLGCLFADHVFAHPDVILFTSYLYVEQGRKYFFSPNLATGFYLLKHWKLPTARGRMLSVLIIVTAAAFLPCSVCAPCSAQRELPALWSAKSFPLDQVNRSCWVFFSFSSAGSLICFPGSAWNFK